MADVDDREIVLHIRTIELPSSPERAAQMTSALAIAKHVAKTGLVST